MRSLRGLDVAVSCYSPELLSHHYGSKAHPARGGFMASGFFGGARSRGERPVFVLEGPDAEEAASRIRAVIDAHPSELPGGSFGTAREAIRQQLRGHLERWGVLEDYDRIRAESFRPTPRPKARPAPETFALWTLPPEPPEVRRWRELDAETKAMNERYEWKGGRC